MEGEVEEGEVEEGVGGGGCGWRRLCGGVGWGGGG